MGIRTRQALIDFSTPPAGRSMRRRRISHVRGRVGVQGGEMASETVKWFNGDRGFGFIKQDDGGADVFAHCSAIMADGFFSLQENQRFEFDIAHGSMDPQAANIRPL
jgi:CspA family cold shock protein